MSQDLSPESIKLIASLINNKNEDLDKVLKARHESLENKIRMIKTTVQENHAVSIEGRDLGRKTNGRVTKLENEIYGEIDTHGNLIKGKEGTTFYLNEIKKLRFTYKTWRHVVITTLILSALFIKESREFIWEKLINFKI